jgi:hypothetical protein
MIGLLLSLALLQDVQITVGDTVWIRRDVDVPRGRTVRPADWQP